MATAIRLLALLLLLAALVPASAHAARSCSSEHRYFGNYPRESEPGWHDEAQGVTHDDRHWFFSQNPDRVLTDYEVCRSPHP